MIDRESVERRVVVVMQMVTALRRHQSRGVEELRADIDLLSAIAHELQVGIQAALDAGAHVLVAGGLDAFEQYRAIPERLVVHGVVPSDVGGAMADLASFRNVLVHHYLLVRVDLVHAKLATAPDHLEAFARALTTWLDQHPAT